MAIEMTAPTPSGSVDQSRRELGGGVGLCVIAMLMVGIGPLLFGALVTENRLDLASVGLTFTVQTVTMGASGILAGAVLKRQHLRAITLICLIALMLMELLFTRQQGSGVLMICALSAIPQGLLMWIGMSTIVSRSADPTRVMAILATSATLAQLVVSGALISMILPKFGVNGGFVTAAVVGAVGFLAAMSIPNQLVMHGPRDGERRSSGSPPARGWAALVVVALVNAAGIAILVYILPLALAGGLPKASAEGAFTALLAGQVIGGALAIMASKRSHYAPVCAGAALVLAVVWSIYGIGASVPIFLAASAVFGITFAFTLPFLMPLAIAADPSRRAAAQYGGASLLGSAVGPLVSSRVVAMFGVHGAIYAGGALLAVAVIVGAFLHFTASAPAVNTGAVEA